MAAGDGGSTAASRWMPLLVAALSPPCDLYRGGVGGTTSRQARNAALATTAYRNYRKIVWAGHNPNADPSTQLVVDDTAEIFAHSDIAPASREDWVFSPVINATSAPGSAGYLYITALRTALSAAFGSKYVNVAAILAAGGTGTGQDAIDVANGHTPFSLRADSIHLGDPGHLVLSAGLVPIIGS